MSHTMKKIAFPLFGAAVLVATSVVGFATVAGQDAQLATDQASLASIQGKIAAAEKTADDAARTASLDLSGAQADRVDADTEIIVDLAERAMTWEDNATYVEARESMMRSYGLSEGSSFMQSFLPPAPVNLDDQGNEYPFIDAAGLNSRTTGVQVRLLSVDGVSYSYMALVDVASTSSDGLGTASNVATIFLTIDSGDTVTSLAGFASTSPPATSKG